MMVTTDRRPLDPDMSTEQLLASLDQLDMPSLGQVLDLVWCTLAWCVAQGVQQSFAAMTQAQQAQVIYTEFLRQSAQFAGTATSSTNDLDRSITKVSTSWARLQVIMGQSLAPTVNTELQTTSVGATPTT